MRTPSLMASLNQSREALCCQEDLLKTLTNKLQPLLFPFRAEEEIKDVKEAERLSSPLHNNIDEDILSVIHQNNASIRELIDQLDIDAEKD